MSKAEFYLGKLEPLLGATLTGRVMDEPGEFYGLVFTLRNGSKRTLWIQSDDEGNGPGSFTLEGC
jgi:hypothetical protein